MKFERSDGDTLPSPHIQYNLYGEFKTYSQHLIMISVTCYSAHPQTLRKLPRSLRYNIAFEHTNWSTTNQSSIAWCSRCRDETSRERKQKQERMRTKRRQELLCPPSISKRLLIGALIRVTKIHNSSTGVGLHRFRWPDNILSLK